MDAAKGKIEKLRLQREQLNAKIQKLESAEKSREKKRDTRRKILIGAYFLDKARKEGAMSSLNEEMLTYLHRSSDRRLFETESEIVFSGEQEA